MSGLMVWAPFVDSLELVTEADLTKMICSDDCWTAQTALRPGDDYAFRINGEDLLPDPRSASQPHGVHGWSRMVDHRAFSWTDTGWKAPSLASAIIYELHVGTFSREGTFDGAITRLQHLVELGVTHIELMPVAAFSGNRGWGYDGTALFAPHHTYGGPDGLKRFVDACHQRRLAVILDVVYNHLGPSGNYLPRFGPYLTDRYGTPWGDAVNFDGADSDKVRKFFCDNAAMWLRDYHVDGLRLDAVHAIVDNSAFTFLEQLAEEVDRLSASLGRPLRLIAESDQNNPRLVQSRERGGYGMDAIWSDDFHHALHALLTGERDGYYSDFGSIADLAKALRQGFVFDRCYSRYRRRTHGRKPVGLDGHQLVVFAQNHDQVGNRPNGERLAHLVSVSRVKMAAALVFCAPFTPLIFQGEEWSASAPFIYFTGHEDQALARAVSEGRRGEFARFGWRTEDVPDPQDETTFLRCKLDWDELITEPHQAILQWYRNLIRLRRNTPALTDGRLENGMVRYDENAQWLTLTRGPITLVCNFSRSTQTMSFHNAENKLLMASEPRITFEGGILTLAPDSVAILEAHVQPEGSN